MGRMIATAIRWTARGIVALLMVTLIVLITFRVAATLRENDDHIPATTTLVPTTLGRVAATISGPADGPAIVLVHGTAAWSGFWSDIAAHLAARGWRVVAIDLPPFGYSDHDAQARYSRADQARRLADLAAALRLGRAVVVGHSFGAGAAAEFALRSPGQVRSLVLVDAALGELDPPTGGGAAGSVIRQGWIAQPLVSATVTNPLLTGTLLRGFVARKDSVDRWLPVIRQPMRRPGTTAAYAAWLPALVAADSGGLSQRSTGLRAIRVPVAMIWGTADTVTPIAQGERIAALTRARSFQRLAGIGHIPHIEAPAAFMAALDRATAHDRAPPRP